MFCLRRYFTRAISFAILVSTALADTVVLKSGEKVEGKIVKETDQQLTLEVKVSASITDERVIPRAEIDRIDKADPETETYKAIVNIQTGNNSLTPAQYEPAIRTLQAFLKQYPEGAHAADVQATLNEFLAEKKRVEGGEAKLRGQWFSKAEVEREKIQIGGSLALEHMKNLSASGDTIGALNTFATIEKPYAGAASMPEMIELARQLVASIKPAVERAIPDQKVLKAQKEKGFADARPENRAEMIAAYKADMAQAEATVAAAEAAGQWPPFIPTNEKALTTLLARVGRESTRLAALQVDKMKKSVQLTETAKQSLAAGDLEATGVTLKEATALWPANELATRLAKEVTAKKAEAAKAPATPAPAPETPKPKTGPATPKPSAALKAAAAATPAPEDPAPFYMTLPGAIGIVVGIAAILAGVNIYKKMKARQAPAE
jgi:hypothetical protein